MVVLRRLPAVELPAYWLAQYIGAFVASACIYGVYYGEFSLFFSDVGLFVVADNVETSRIITSEADCIRSLTSLS
jgi:glycerol uptake facilitator-like aquaporin